MNEQDKSLPKAQATWTRVYMSL